MLLRNKIGKKTKREGEKFENCCDCSKDIEIKYNRGKKSGSQKNNIGFGTGKLKDKDDYRCDKCGLFTYYKKPREFVCMISDAKIRNKFSSYVNGGGFGDGEEAENNKQEQN